MVGVRTEYAIPGLPCRDLDDVLPFYTALGFEVTYQQVRPNPYAAVRRGGIDLHFFGVPEFDPANSMGSVERVVAAAARQADSHGDEAAGIRVLENGLARHADAPAAERLPALVYLAELRLRTGERDAAAALLAEVDGLDLSAAERAAHDPDLRTAAELVTELATRSAGDLRP